MMRLLRLGLAALFSVSIAHAQGTFGGGGGSGTGGSGTVTSIGAGACLAASPSSPITGSGTLNFSLPVTSKAALFTAANCNGYNYTGAAAVATLPAAATGLFIAVANNGSGTLTLSPPSGLIYGSGSSGANYGLTAGSSGILLSDGTNYILIGGNGAAAGVTSFNTRTGAVTLSSGDVTAALGFTPAHSGANSDITSLSGLTTPIPIAAGGTNSTSAAAAQTALVSKNQHGSATLTLGPNEHYATTCNNSDAGCTTGTWSTPAVWTLPLHGGINDGDVVIIGDDGGANGAGLVTSTNTNTIAVESGYSINGTVNGTLIMGGPSERIGCLYNATATNWDCKPTIQLGTSAYFFVAQGLGTAPTWVILGGDLANCTNTGNCQVQTVLNGNVPATTSTSQTLTTKTIQLTNAGVLEEAQVANSSTGTTVNTLTTITSTGAQITGTGPLTGVIGICKSNCGTTGVPAVVIIGPATCAFDSGGVTEGHLVIPSTATAGNCADGGTSQPTGTLVLGLSTQTVSGAGTAIIILQPQAVTNTSGGGSGSVTTVSVVTVNGVSGTVANPTTTPAISLTLGAITPTTVNGLTITTTTGTFTVAAGKTLTVNNTLTFTGTDGSSVAFGAGGTVSYAAGANPSATAGPTAVNGTAATFMTSDSAPAVQKATSGQFGIVECGSGTTCTSGVISTTGGGTGTPAVGNTTAVTVNANATTDQLLQELHPANASFNTSNMVIRLHQSGIFSTFLTPQITVKAKLCSSSNSGCITLASIQTAATVSGANNQFVFETSCGVSATGSTGTLTCHGTQFADLTSGSVVAATYTDNNTGASSTFDLTGANFIDFTVAFSSASASNTATGQLAYEAPQGFGGTVTSVATTSPITGGTITGTGTIACATCATGPGSSTSGDLASFNGTGGIGLLDSNVPAANVVTAASPGAGIAHFAGSTQAVTSSKVSLTADVTGALPNANIANPSVNVNGTTCTLGATECPIGFPNYQASTWYIPEMPGLAVQFGAVQATSTVYCGPGFLPAMTISALSADVTTLKAAGNVQLAIFSNGSWNRPGTLLGNTGSITTGSTGAVSAALAGGNLALTGGMYWLCDQMDATAGGTSTLRAITGNSSLLGPTLMGSATLANVMSGTFFSAVTTPGTFNAWASFISGTTWTELTTNVAPLVGEEAVSQP